MESLLAWRKTQVNEIKIKLMEHNLFGDPQLKKFMIILNLFEEYGREFQGSIPLLRGNYLKYDLKNNQGKKPVVLLSAVA